MIRKHPIPDSITRLAGVQAGVVGTAQLRAAGLSATVTHRLLRDGVLTRVTPGVLSLDGTPTWLGRAWAGVLLGGPGAALGFAAAAHLHGLGEAPETIEVFIQPQSRRRDRPGWSFVRGSRPTTGEPPRTKVADTLVDLCGAAAEDQIAAILADAISGRRITAKRLLEALGRRRRVVHGALIRDILGDVAAGAHSPLERRYARDVERAHGLPAARRQASPVGKYRADAWYEEFGVVVELDGRVHHRGAAAFGDLQRDNDHRLAGLLTLRFGWAQVVKTPCQVAVTVAGALVAGGWPGLPSRCPRCAAVPRG